MRLEVGEEITGGEKLEDKVKLHMYVGETSRSGFERGYEHLDGVKQLKTSSHLLNHFLDQHEGEDWDKVDVRMEIKTFARTAFEEYKGGGG